MWNEHTDTDLWFSGLASDLGHCVGVTTEAVYLCFGPHVPYLTAITTHLHISVKYQQWISSNYTHTHTHTFNGPFSGTTRVSKGKTNLDFTEARDSEWQWHQLGICKSAPRSRQITTPVPHRSVFYRPDAIPATQPTATKHWRQQHWRQFLASTDILFHKHLYCQANISWKKQLKWSYVYVYCHIVYKHKQRANYGTNSSTAYQCQHLPQAAEWTRTTTAYDNTNFCLSKV